MKDREFLIWLHELLVCIYKESTCFDYMHKFRCIIADYDKGKETINTGQGKNSMQELLKDE
jgi:hypothetical protein